MTDRGIRFATLATLGAALAFTGSTGLAEETPDAEAIFAGGCFWCMEEAFDKVDGVLSTTSGFSGGSTESPTYDQVVAGGTGHTEAVRIEYDPAQVDYAELLHVYWRNIDPFVENRQFCDEGDSYRSAIFYRNDQQRRLAEATKAELEERFGREIATQLEAFEAFWAVEDAHQNFYETNPMRYNFYKSACGRHERLVEIWGDEAGGLSEAGEIAHAQGE